MILGNNPYRVRAEENLDRCFMRHGMQGSLLLLMKRQ